MKTSLNASGTLPCNHGDGGHNGHGGIGRGTDRCRHLRCMDAHNAEADLGLHSFRLGLNAFADLTQEEFRGRVLGFQSGRRNDTAEEAGNHESARYDHDDLPLAIPNAVYWRKTGVVTCVKNQGKCGPSVQNSILHACYYY